jgi:hypothetical protein
MTVPQILTALRPVKRMSRQTLYNHIRKLKIKPLGVRQIPQHYPADTPTRIIIRLGVGRPGTTKLRRAA